MFWTDSYLVCEETDALNVAIGTDGLNFIAYLLPAIIGDSMFVKK